MSEIEPSLQTNFLIFVLQDDEEDESAPAKEEVPQREDPLETKPTPLRKTRAASAKEGTTTRASTGDAAKTTLGATMPRPRGAYKKGQGEFSNELTVEVWRDLVGEEMPYNGITHARAIPGIDEFTVHDSDNVGKKGVEHVVQCFFNSLACLGLCEGR